MRIKRQPLLHDCPPWWGRSHILGSCKLWDMMGQQASMTSMTSMAYQWHITILRFTEFTAVYLCPLDLASHQVPGENVEFIPGPFEAPENAAFRKASGLGEVP